MIKSIFELFEMFIRNGGGYEKLLKELDLMLRTVKTVATSEYTEPITSSVDFDYSTIWDEFQKGQQTDHLFEQIMNVGIKDIGNKILSQIANVLSRAENVIYTDGPNNIENVINSLNAFCTQPDVCIQSPEDNAQYRIHQHDYINEQIPIITDLNRTVSVFHSNLCPQGTAYIGRLETLQLKVQDDCMFEICDERRPFRTIGPDMGRMCFRSCVKAECTDIDSWTKIISG